MLAVALFYILPGYSVPAFWYAIVFGIAAVAAMGFWAFNRVNENEAAAFADEHFDLKDSIWSCVQFADQGESGGFYELQSNQTENRVSESYLESIQSQPAYRVAFLGFLLILISVALGFVPTSQKIVDKQREESDTLAMTSAANEELREMVRELEASIDNEEERKLIEPDKLRKWVDELAETKDRKEAMRQYARLELKLNRAADALQKRKDEKLLDAAALELKKDDASRELGKKLEQKKYDQAAKDLKKLKPEKLDPEKLKNLSEKRKEIARLKAMANRMADAVRNTRRTKSNSDSNRKPSDQDVAKSSEADAEADEAADEDMSELAEDIEDLEEALEELDEKMELAENDDDGMDEEEMEECEACRGEIEEDLDDLAEKLMRLARKRSAAQKLKKLSKRCSQCQSMALTRSKGGKKAGQGSVDSRREDDNKKNTNNQQYTRLKGIKGKGKSLIKTEAASDGSGVSGRKHSAKKRDFKRQFESFVGREDIPEDLKSGVKNYFSNIHQTEDDSKSDNKSNADKK